MSIEQEDPITRVNCDGDGCRKNYEGVEGFMSAVREAKAHGWIVVPVHDNSGEWRHYCPSCKRELGDD